MVSDGLPYQHADFKIPPVTGDIDKIVKNIEAFKCLSSLLLFADHSASNITSCSKYYTKQQLPASLRRDIFISLKQLLQAHICNYFIVESTNVLPQLIESIDLYDHATQEEIMQLLLFVMIDLNFVPLKELAVLSLHLQSKI
ncbi:hypothetical protein BDF20DRAFT_195133 [Mycotypha africana]|uniref:uncharacterized protein n=1 Tax=Mycotypha africana TaxID=64632 RepID=UPI002300E271|nr:uncharacterized protein BDF20DRAFT_195133 [Mycotypha africana]KAI8967888.1 hypothetical protein BDF20DRAFT_195133 [Mycotypha africana]